MVSRVLVAAVLALAVLAGPFRFAATAQDDTPKAKPLDGAMQAVQADLQAGKIDPAIAKLEAILKDKPKDEQARLLLVIVTQKKAQDLLPDRKASVPAFLKSAEAARSAIANIKDLNADKAAFLGAVFYNGARSLAVDGKPEQSIAMLKEAFDAGFADFETFGKDEELDSLRKRGDFKALVASLKDKKDAADKKRAEAIKAEVPKLLKENKEFPFSFTLPDINDKKLSLADLKGKVVIVDFWATWCAPCVQEIPHFVDLYATYKGKGLEVVGISYEEGTPAEGKKLIKTFLDENKVPYRCLIGDEKTQMLVPGFEGYPTTLFIDRAGKVRLKIEGYHAKDVLEEIVKTLLNEKAE